MKATSLILFALFVISCSNDNQPTDPIVEDQTNIKEYPVEGDLKQKANRHVTTTLSIPSSEKFTLEVFEAHLDDDGVIDAIVTVNRKNKAIDDAADSPNTPQIVEMGYMGNYNLLFHYDGAKNTFSKPVPIGSSAMVPLKVTFANIQSEFFKDAIVEYRIRDGAYHNYFFVQNGTIQLVLQHPVYSGFADPEGKYYVANFEAKTSSNVKDIVVFKGEYTGPIPEDKLAIFSPNISMLKEEAFRFVYLPQKRKYGVNPKDVNF